MNKPLPEKGRAVISMQGRDAARSMVIVDVLDADYVLVADGDLRRIEHPKKKKLKHLRLTWQMMEALASGSEDGMPVNNAAIRAFLTNGTGPNAAD